MFKEKEAVGCQRSGEDLLWHGRNGDRGFAFQSVSADVDIKSTAFFLNWLEKPPLATLPAHHCRPSLRGGGLGGLGTARSSPPDVQAWSWYSLYLALPSAPVLWVVGNLTAQPGNIPAGRKNLEGLEREIQKQNWRHKDKNRSPQARLFGRGDKGGLVEEWIEWGKVGQRAGESEERAHSWFLPEDYHLKHLYSPAMSPLGRDQDILHPLYSKTCKISVNRSVPDSRVTNLPTPPQICLITKFFLKKVLIPPYRKAHPHLWCFLWNNRNRSKGWKNGQSLT